MEKNTSLQHREEKIDLGKIVGIAVGHKKEMGSIIVGATMCAGVISLALPVEYESVTLVQTRSVGKDLGSASSVAAAMGISISGSSSADSPNNYMELMKSRHVLEPVIDSMEWANEKSKPAVTAFAKKHLDIKNIKKTNLIEVKAKGGTPEEAQKISQGVVNSFLALQTDMNQQTQSLLVKFLDERIVQAKNEAEDAAKKLAEYSKEHKIYSPDDQIKGALDQLNTYDKSIAEMEVDNKTAQAQYESSTSKLGEQKSLSKKFRINDNANVVAIRSKIVEKQVELVELTARYTEENPRVIQARNDLQKLKKLLMQEVDAVVDSNVSSVNTVHDSILKDQVEAEAKIAASNASLTALKDKRGEKEAELKGLPDGAMEYIQLKSDVELKQEVYLSLVKEYEKDRVQEAMESMDIQIIDEANLPDADKPSGPNRKLIILVGAILGMIASLLYVIKSYKKELE